MTRNVSSFRDEKEFVVLSACGDDGDESLGEYLTHLPRLTWHTEIMKKNDVDDMFIVDFCVFDSNNKQMIASSFPVNISKTNADERFIAEVTYHSEHAGDNFLFRSVITRYQVNKASNPILNKSLNLFNLGKIK